MSLALQGISLSRVLPPRFSNLLELLFHSLLVVPLHGLLSVRTTRTCEVSQSASIRLSKRDLCLNMCRVRETDNGAQRELTDATARSRGKTVS
jgi:hypothetical protein